MSISKVHPVASVITVIYLGLFLSACGGDGADAGPAIVNNDNTTNNDNSAIVVKDIEKFSTAYTDFNTYNTVLGLPPKPYSGFKESYVDSKLPAVGSPNRPTYQVASQTQVFKKAALAAVTTDSVVNLADKAGESIDTIVVNNEPTILNTVVAEVTKTSQLIPLIKNNARIIITKELDVDSQVNITSNNVILECIGQGGFKGKQDYEATPAWRPDELKNVGIVNRVTSALAVSANNVRIEGCSFDNTQAIIATNSVGLKVKDIKVTNSPGYGVIYGSGNSFSAITDSNFKKGYGSGIAVLSDNHDIFLNKNVVEDGIGGSNWHAGILIAARDTYNKIGSTDFLMVDNFYWAPASIMAERKAPSNIYATNNSIYRNKSSGMYLDGANLAYVRDNDIAQNSKEGMCLDNGTIGAFVYGNSINANGKRWGKTDLMLERDFVLRYGRTDDGSAKAKLPGVSIDNAMYNFVVSNHIFNNFGSGIKMVRTSFDNYIGRNNLDSNNKGANDTFFFFGIEVGGAIADAPSIDLDFKPSMGNIIYQNMINGAHYAGIQFCVDCADNEVFDNTINKPTHWAIEQNSPNTQNFFLNNFSTSKSRNANLNNNSLDGNTLKGGGSVFDPKWESSIVAFEQQDKQNPPPINSNVFAGSSTIRFWDLKASFPSSSTINRGFGGSEYVDLNYYVNRIITNYKPKEVFIYSGDNDIDAGKSPAIVQYDFTELVKNIHAAAPGVQINLMSIKPSPSRWRLNAKFLEVNTLMRKHADELAYVDYIDIYSPLIGSNGQPNPAFYAEDGLHLNSQGYAVISAEVSKYLDK